MYGSWHFKPYPDRELNEVVQGTEQWRLHDEAESSSDSSVQGDGDMTPVQEAAQTLHHSYFLTI